MNDLVLKFGATLLMSGAIGYFSHSLLKAKDLLTLSNNKKDEKKAVIAILTVVNIIIFYCIYALIDLINISNTLVIGLSLVISFIVSVWLSLTLFPKIITSFNESINVRRAKEGKAHFNHQLPRDKLFDNNKRKYVYVFTLTGEYIAAGYLQDYQHDADEYYEIILKSPDSASKISIEDIEDTFEKNEFEILIDFEKQVKYYYVNI